MYIILQLGLSLFERAFQMHREGHGEPMNYNASMQQIIIPIQVVNDLLCRFMITFNIKIGMVG